MISDDIFCKWSTNQLKVQMFPDFVTTVKTFYLHTIQIPDIKMEFKITPFNQLELNELYKLLQLRIDIFAVEQNCVYNDLDGNDEVAFHLWAIEASEVVGYLRILPANTRFKEVSIGRLVVNKNHRFKGLARDLMQQAHNWINKEWKSNCIQISAQKYLKAFYQSLGYDIISDEYLEDGIPHFKMELKIADSEN
ncbi:MAG: GNAT family N-acetyltransferase [Carboxylicivirga sp.]|jgi:ElaA protein|nr:GNAT family N-acetyltransferase [Carboxylicivirga sp.]